MSNTHEHLEHAQHAAPGFDKRVAVTIAMIAAALAGVSVLGHRAHNEVLSLQGEAAVQEVKASNGYAWYQATRGRQQALEINRQTLELQPTSKARDDQDRRDEVSRKWQVKIEEYAGELKERKAEADAAKERAKGLIDESHAVHRRGNWLDVGHLAVEFGLVLASIAVLTKRRVFWFAGIAAAAVGLAATASAFALPTGHVEHETTRVDGSGGH